MYIPVALNNSTGSKGATNLPVSFNNLRTKLARTLLTAFAGSIGIIGIALILSVSTGVNNYIDAVQRDTLAGWRSPSAPDKERKYDE